MVSKAGRSEERDESAEPIEAGRALEVVKCAPCGLATDAGPLSSDALVYHNQKGANLTLPGHSSSLIFSFVFARVTRYSSAVVICY